MTRQSAKESAKRTSSWRLEAMGLLLCLGLAGCASQRAYSEGNSLFAQGRAEAGLAKLEEAVKLDPRNAEYRIGLANQRASSINRMLAGAEASRREGRLVEAEQLYLRVLSMDSANVMAVQGLSSLTLERRHQKVVSSLQQSWDARAEAPLNEEDTLGTLRTVLGENPAFKPASALKAQIEETRSQAAREPRLAQAYRKPITLEFREASLRSVFDFISQVSGLNFFFDREVRGDTPVTVMARDTSIEDALQVLLRTNQLERTVLNDNSLMIYPNSAQKLRDYQTLSVRTFYIVNADVKVLAATLKSIVKVRDLAIDERLGLITVRDTPEVIRMADRLIALHDQGDPEVMLDLEVLEVQRSKLTELGVHWPDQVGFSPLEIAGQPLTVAGLRQLNQSTIAASVGGITINALGQDQNSNTLANPRIRVRNREKAKVVIGDRVPVITTTATSTGFVSESISYLDVGLKLDVEPNVHLDGDVAIRVNLEVSSLVKEVTTKSGALSYQIGTRGANTVLRLRDGETQVLAGLISDDDRSSADKIPGLGDLPLLRRVFGSQRDNTQRSEILLSITPHVVRSLRRADLSVSEFDSGTEGSVGGGAMRLAPTAQALPDGLKPRPPRLEVTSRSQPEFAQPERQPGAASVPAMPEGTFP